MKRIYIIVEGQTEAEFVNQCLSPYLSMTYEMYDVRPILLQTSPGHKGGDMKFERFKWNAERFLKQEKNILLSSFIDFYRLHKDFPGYEEAKSILDVRERVLFLELEMQKQITDRRFLPYIQLHEFEALLFSDKVWIKIIPDIPPTNQAKLEQIINQYPNPELINGGAETAPSKRLLKLIPGYQKTLHGPYIAMEIAIPKIREKCPRFDEWLTKLTLAFKAS